uniref:Putative secreted peptide n=1 Tax=Anopheles braziliensis TaxID=58242 RepID=A0A2M3ZU59_9DIPT
MLPFCAVLLITLAPLSSRSQQRATRLPPLDPTRIRIRESRRRVAKAKTASVDAQAARYDANGTHSPP